MPPGGAPRGRWVPGRGGERGGCLQGCSGKASVVAKGAWCCPKHGTPALGGSGALPPRRDRCPRGRPVFWNNPRALHGGEGRAGRRRENPRGWIPAGSWGAAGWGSRHSALPPPLGGTERPLCGSWARQEGGMRWVWGGCTGSGRGLPGPRGAALPWRNLCRGSSPASAAPNRAGTGSESDGTGRAAAVAAWGRVGGLGAACPPTPRCGDNSQGSRCSCRLSL